MSEPLYKEGYRFGTGNDEVTIRKVYPAGSGYAPSGHWYLVYCPDFGEDELPEEEVTRLKQMAEDAGWKELDDFMEEKIHELKTTQKKITKTANKIMIETIREALGWEKGSIHDCANEIRRLRKRDAMITQYDEGISGSIKKISFVKCTTVLKGEAVILINPENCRHIPRLLVEGSSSGEPNATWTDKVEELEGFENWMEENVIQCSEGYATQDAQYRNRIPNLEELRKYYQKEFL